MAPDATNVAPETAQVEPVVSPYDRALDNAAASRKSGKWDEARLELNGALKLAQTPAEKSAVYGQIGSTYEAQGNHAQGQAQFRQAMSVPDVPAAQKLSANLALATSLRDGKNYVEAGKEIDAILANEDYDVGLNEYLLALNIRGNAQAQAKDWERARQTFDEIVQMPANEEDLTSAAVYARASAQLNSAKSYLEENKPVQARDQLRELKKTMLALPKGAAMTDFFSWVTQQSIAQSYLIEKNKTSARIELEKLLAMPQLPEEFATQAKEDLATLKVPATAK